MKYCFFTIIMASLYFPSFAQVEAPFSFTSEDDNKVVQETDSGKYYAATGNTDRTVFINEDLKYRLLDKDRKTLVEGTVSNDGEKFLHEGRWIEYYNSGKIKNTGYYHKDKPVGTWQKYYPDGKLMSVYSFALIESGSSYSCMAGTYEEFFENGQLKVTGFYKAVIDDRGKDTVSIQDPETGKMITRTVTSTRPRAEKFGTWEYYNESGELVKKDEL